MPRCIQRQPPASARRQRWLVAKITGFLEYTREVPLRRPVVERINDWFEVYHEFPEEKVRTQGARCMDCGVPFCHTGCPLNNAIPASTNLLHPDPLRQPTPPLPPPKNFPQ